MKKMHFLLTMALGIAGASLMGCSDKESVAGGPGSETTNGIMAMVDGNAAPYAAVALRKVNHMADSAQMENSIVVPDAFADNKGKFNLDVPSDGDYRLTVMYGGSAYSKVVSAESYTSLDTVNLSATAVMKGEVDIPEGSSLLWVGVLGTDILVQTDANGVFVIPSLPAGDSLQLYIVSEDYNDVIDRKNVFFTPSESAYESYKSPMVIPEEPDRDTVDVPMDTVKKVVVLQDDGTLASNARVALRPMDFRSEKLVLQNNLVTPDVISDSDGAFSMEWPDSGSYRLTVTSGEFSFSKVYDAKALADVDTVRLSASATISSKVTLLGGERFAWVGVYGLDMMVKTNSAGAYVLPALPSGDSLKLYFVHSDSTEPFVELPVSPLHEGTNYIKVSKLLYDFEQDVSNWYMSVDTLWKGTTFYDSEGNNDSYHKLADHLEMDKDRGSMVFHSKYKIANDPYAWVLVGTGMREVYNFVAVDSIEFYAKGNGNIRVALENWESYDSSSKAASGWVKVSSSWQRVVITPADLCYGVSDSSDCDGSWDSVKNNVKQIHFFPAGGSEIYIDDVKLYGALF